MIKMSQKTAAEADIGVLDGWQLWQGHQTKTMMTNILVVCVTGSVLTSRVSFIGKQSKDFCVCVLGKNQLERKESKTMSDVTSGGQDLSVSPVRAHNC